MSKTVMELRLNAQFSDHAFLYLYKWSMTLWLVTTIVLETLKLS